MSLELLTFSNISIIGLPASSRGGLGGGGVVVTRSQAIGVFEVDLLFYYCFISEGRSLC